MNWYEAYFSEEAYELDQWAYYENNRIKASKLKKFATKLESKYRKHHSISKHESPIPRGGLRKELLHK